MKETEQKTEQNRRGVSSLKRLLGDNEYILCAAIHFKDGNEYEHQPRNISTGFVVAGRRHHNCFYTAWQLGYDRSKTTERDIQGFLTNTDRFVDRDEAAIIAKNAGQADVEDHLISENLY